MTASAPLPGGPVSARIEAAAKAAHRHDFGVAPSAKWEDSSEALRADYLTSATKALAAADAILFDDAAIERAAKALFELHPVARGHQPWDALKHDSIVRVSFLHDARAVVAALKGDDQ